MNLRTILEHQDSSECTLDTELKEIIKLHGHGAVQIIFDTGQ
jgi:hypothetical protein